jgi:putative phosphoribosyl transferase
MGAIASGGAWVLNEDVIRALKLSGRMIQDVAEREVRELKRREEVYRGRRPPLDVHGRIVILVDDGIATSSTMRAAIAALRRLGPARLVVVVPTASASTCEEIGALVDECICTITPDPFFAVRAWYEDFSQRL